MGRIIEETAETEPPPEEADEEKAVEEKASSKMQNQIQNPEPKTKKGWPHAVVIMPSGQKQTADGHWIDFDVIYYQLIQPALEESEFEAIRADEGAMGGNTLTDIFQELLLADLVVTDLSIDNASVSYKLGIRHAMRKRGLIHLHSERSYVPHGILNVQVIAYHCDPNGKPDPKHKIKDKRAIVKAAREIRDFGHKQIQSPIFQLLNGLAEPNLKLLQTPLAINYWREYKEWKERVTLAERQKRIGDILYHL
ncbi:hypothetical protein HYR99_39895 [Candidatus Poribacteria bacterium]|nr:hypothetical protein [Candidatus Poribacteria bacterium]